MKHAKVLFLTLGFVLTIAQAQVPVVDVSPDKAIYQGKSLGNMIKQIAEQVKSNKTLVEVANTAYETRNDISDMLRLQDDIKRALLTVKDVSDLKWAKMQNLFTGATGISLNYRGLIPNSAYGNSARIFQKGSGFGDGAKTTFHDLDMRSENKITPQQMFESYTTAKNTQLVLDDATSIRKIQIAEFYSSAADEMLEKAYELQAAVNTDNRMSMNSAERLTLLNQCNEMVLKSSELRTQSDALRQEAITPSEAQKGMIRQQRQRLLIDLM